MCQLTNPHQNPQNWSNPKKFFVTFEICFLTFSVYIGSAIFSAGIQNVMTVFGVSQVAATLGLTLFVAGYAVGPMVWEPLSEIPQVGRNPFYILTPAVNFGMLLVFRFLTGFIGSPALATGGASIGDMYTPSKRTYGLAVWGIGAVCGPALGPLVGGFAVQAKGWNWAILELMCCPDSAWLCWCSCSPRRPPPTSSTAARGACASSPETRGLSLSRSWLARK